MSRVVFDCSLRIDQSMLNSRILVRRSFCGRGPVGSYYSWGRGWRDKIRSYVYGSGLVEVMWGGGFRRHKLARPFLGISGRGGVKGGARHGVDLGPGQKSIVSSSWCRLGWYGRDLIRRCTPFTLAPHLELCTLHSRERRERDNLSTGCHTVQWVSKSLWQGNIFPKCKWPNWRYEGILLPITAVLGVGTFASY